MAELTKAIARLMEERERTEQAPVEADDSPKLRDVLDAVRAAVTPGERGLAEALTRQLFDRAATDLLSDGTVSALATLALAFFRFVVERSPSEPRVVLTEASVAGWDAATMIVHTLMRDRPFIVETVQECLHAAGCTVRRLLHPIFTVERDGRGALLAVTPPTESVGRRESVLHVEIDPVADPEGLSELLVDRLTAVVRATDDYQAMRNKAEELADELRGGPLPRPWNADVDEVAAFLDWLGQKNFVFLGYREYQFASQGTDRTAAVRPGSGLGILTDETASSFAQPRALPADVRRRLVEPPVYVVSKTNAESPIHRRAHMDYIGIKEIDSGGVVVGERRFLGLFTARAYAQEPITVPLVRMKLAAILESEGASEGSHSYRQIVEAFNSMPRVELLASEVPALLATVKAIIGAEGGADVTVVQHPGPLGRGAFVLVILPRERFSNELYRQTEARLIQALGATAMLERRLALDDSDQVRMHFYLVAATDSLRTTVTGELRAQVASLLRTWEDRLRDALLEHFPRDQARALAARYTAALSPHYKTTTDTAAAVRDITCLEALLATRSPQVDVVNPDTAGATRADQRFTTVKLFLVDEELILSDFLPVLENLGLKVFAQDPLDLVVPDLGAARMHSFFVHDRNGLRLDAATATPLLRSALPLLYRNQIESDGLNALMLSTGLTWREVDLLRAYVNHALQIGTAVSRGAIIAALTAHPPSAHLMWEYVDTKFNPVDPASARERSKLRLPDIEARFNASLDAVDSVGDDRILRGLFRAVTATVRTSYFQPAAAPGGLERTTLAIKIDCTQMPPLPGLQPLYEIYVHAPEVEGVHLRASKVARGGIRLSDRLDDFRTEILELMQTQTVKNAVIVPAGAKGGFIVKRRAGTPASAAQVTAAYRTFIGALLDLTDNIVQGRVESPAGVLLYDDLDPYLVIAADKGTSAFSDIANDVAQQRRFWLGDAFASGGTQGYDHKKEGITARGAWECVRRHFRELGRDADAEPISVIGIGDMSGDVFGNGLLLSRRFLLRAAFNHQHIFLDPTPDAARSFAERERLFQLPRSTWADYDTHVISGGGGVFLRSAKRLALAPAARTLLGITDNSPSGEEVIRAILRMDADLLWNGGIGTYVKASDETHAAVGDSANDAVRIDARELRVAVVAEGGNLGFTQRARVEYALYGGRINTDAIDNSAGVDMSDHEVNLKIALAGAVEAGQLRATERNQILAEVAADVAQRVLAHNRRQARALSLDQRRSQTRLKEFRDHMAQLETDGLLDRRAEVLPDRQALRERRGAFLGLTRPELAVVLAHSKLVLQRRLLESALPDDATFERYLRGYFPDAINQRFGQGIRSHRLRREIIAVEMANALVDTMGMTFVSRVARDTGRDAVSVVRAWHIVMVGSGGIDVAGQIADAHPPLPVAAELSCWLSFEAAIEGAVKWVIETQPADAAISDLTQAVGTPAQELTAALPSMLPATAQTAFVAASEGLAAAGTPRPLAQRLVALDRLAELFEIIEIAAGLEVARAMVAEVYYRVAALVDLDWIRQALLELPHEDRWDRRAVEELYEAIVRARRQLTYDTLAYRQDGHVVEGCLQQYAAARHAELAQLNALISDIKGGHRASLSALVVVIRELGRLAGQVV